MPRQASVVPPIHGRFHSDSEWKILQVKNRRILLAWPDFYPIRNLERKQIFRTTFFVAQNH